MGINNKIIAFLTSLFSKEITTILVAALPIFELRLSIPLALMKFHMSLQEAFFLSLVGNILPIVPFLLFLRWSVNRLEHMKGIGKFLRWWFERAQKKSDVVQSYGFWGLVIFVAIPLPGTGAWTGCVVATLFNFKLPKAFLAISLGVLGAAIIVLLTCIGIGNIWSIST
ncbi:MAG: small multi-drug export protein [Candidatus Omnitrophota bacterium]|nr:small multi-drug export protein [Candidatus Omnitrophota bacterium]